MSPKKRALEGDQPKTPVLGNASKKRCITDFFSPRTNPAKDNNPQQTNGEAEEISVQETIISQPKTNSDKDKPFMSNLYSSATKRYTTPAKTSNVTICNSSVHSSPLISNTNQHDNLDEQHHLHTQYKFLYHPHRRDIKKRGPDDPDYDERTLYLTEKFLNEQTPALRQWWLIKQRNMDAILFFKMGKFYELFNEDAVIGVNNLDITFMKGDETKPAHAGFPEVSYEKYSRQLIEKGFKVIRIEQTETPAMMEERCQITGKKGKFDKVVRREVCRATTKGTQMLGVTQTVFHSPHNQYLLAIKESDQDSNEQINCKQFGICFVDVTISKMYLGQFVDDHNYSRLNILLSHHKPTEVLYEKGNISRETHQAILRSGALLSPLRANKEFWPIKKALAYIKAHSIFVDETTGSFEWPKFLRNLFDNDGSENLLSHEPKSDYNEGLEAFGAIVFYLQSLLIADQVLKCITFDLYQPPTTRNCVRGIDDNDVEKRIPLPPMILDHIALRNLEVFENSDGGAFLTLYESINYCKTHFGQRLLKNWLCSPLCDIEQINNRLDAVEALVSNTNASLMNEITHILAQTPDLERLLSKVKSQCFKSESDTRAIMFDGDHHSKAKISSFLNLLLNFKRLRKFITSIDKSAVRCGSPILKRLLTLAEEGGLFPDYQSTLDYFETAFDHEQAKRTGRIIPSPGVDRDYDKHKSEIESINRKLDDYLEEQKGVLKCRSIDYFGTAKNRFQIQVPEAYCKNVPDDYRIETTRKGFKRYYTTRIDKLFQKLTISEEDMKRTLDNIMTKIFTQFSAKMSLWTSAIECMAILDVLQSIASYVRSLKARDIDISRPEFRPPHENAPIIQYFNGRHPALVKNNHNFTPNDLKIDQKLILLTGANMGGKSTIMRQTALLTILAQIGCFVTASKMILTPVDRIFSRLGASDRLLEGESTFYTELVETSAMLRYASKDSLLLLDELGRGTSTYDGTAIAFAVATEITKNVQSRCMFSTHYHSLVRDFANDPDIRLAHMGCKVEKKSLPGDKNDHFDPDPLKESITFLYKITDGPVSRSYGFNVAKLAGLEDSIISDAYSKSKELELSCNILEKTQTVCRQAEGQRLDRQALKTKILSEISIST